MHRAFAANLLAVVILSGSTVLGQGQIGVSQPTQLVPTTAVNPNVGDYVPGAGSAMGDVSGDGYDDLLFCFIDNSPQNGGRRGTAIIDGRDGTILLSHTHRSPYGLNDLWGEEICVIGDVDGDGTAEYAISDWAKNEVKVYWGRTVFPVHYSSNLMCTIKVDPNENNQGTTRRFGVALSPAGDITGDGVPDLLVGDGIVEIGGGNPNISEGAVYIFSGSELRGAYRAANYASTNGPTVYPEMDSSMHSGRIIQNRASTGVSDFGEQVFGGMDATGDGIPDILVTARTVNFFDSGTTQKSGVLFISGSSIHQSPLHTFVSPPPVMIGNQTQSHAQTQRYNFGKSIAFIMDIEDPSGALGNDAGSDIPYAEADILIGDPGTYYAPPGAQVTGDPGFAFVFSSASASLLEVQKGTIKVVGSTDSGSSMGHRVASAGDVNDDGKGDYWVAEPHWWFPGNQTDPADPKNLSDARGRVILVLGGSFGSVEQNTAFIEDDELGTGPFTSFGSGMASSGSEAVYIPNLVIPGPGFMTFSRFSHGNGPRHELGSLEYHRP